MPAGILYLLACIILLSVAIISRRRQASFFAPGFVVAASLALYYPVRGLVVTSGLSVSTNHRVLVKADSGAAAVAGLCVLAAAAFAVGYFLVPTARRTEQSGRDIIPSRVAPIGALLWIVGLIPLAQRASASIGFLSGESGPAGFVAQVLSLVAFGHFMGIVLLYSKRPSRGWRIALLVPSLVAAGAGGSKDLFVRAVLAAVVGSWWLVEPTRSGRRKRPVAGVLLVVTTIFIVFPIITAYRISTELHGGDAAAAIKDIPTVLREYDLASGVPTGDRGLDAYAISSLGYLSSRLHGWDSLVLVSGAPRQPELLPLTYLALSPLTIFLPGTSLGAPAEPVGFTFARQFWGTPANEPTFIAIGLFPDGILTHGLGLASLLMVALGSTVAVAERLTCKGPQLLLVYPLFLASMQFERDAGFVIGGSLREVAVASLIFLGCTRGVRSKKDIPCT